MSESSPIVPPPGSPAPWDPKRIAALLAKDGQLLLPRLDLLENAQCALDDVIDVMGRATIEAVLRMSAAAIAGPRQQGKNADFRRCPTCLIRTQRFPVDSTDFPKFSGS